MVLPPSRNGNGGGRRSIAAVLSVSLIASASSFAPRSCLRRPSIPARRNDASSDVDAIALRRRECCHRPSSSSRSRSSRSRSATPLGLFVASKDDSVLVADERSELEDDDDDDSDVDDRVADLATPSTPDEGGAASSATRDVANITEGGDDFAATSAVVVDDGGLFWRGVVVILCALWASNFACAKVVLAQPGVDPSLYAVARFSIAALSLLPGTLDAVRNGKISGETARGAIVCGSWVAFGYLGQTVGLMTTTPSRACVICSLNCIFVAIIAELTRIDRAKERGYVADFDLRKLIPALIAVAGVAIIELKGAAGNPTWGDLLCFSQPIGFGMGYLQLEELMKREPSAALPVSGIKLAVVAAAACLLFEASPHAAADVAAGAVIVVGGPPPPPGGGFRIPDFAPILSSPVALGAIFYTGLITTSLALWVESVAFQRVKATDASVILTTEPLFAAAASAVLVGETFGTSDAIGAFFIVGACIYAIRMEDSSREVCSDETNVCVIVEEL